MKRHLLATLLLIATLTARDALAHDAKLHKGKPVEGEVVSLSGDFLQLKSEDGAMSVSLDAKTKFERGDELVSRESIKPGDHVSVLGTKLEDGMVAREIIVHPAGSPHHSDQGAGEHADHSAKKDDHATGGL